MISAATGAMALVMVFACEGARAGIPACGNHPDRMFCKFWQVFSG